MYLEKIEINGFKSFAKKSVLDFRPGITGIVGPNGSGKSNCADAIRWVLGEQSLKNLRGKKSKDIIFSGSDKKARLGLAEVSLYFNNEKDEAKIDMSEICITRKLFRNGDSEYLINKKKSRLSDIQMLLAQAGVANTSYSIIGQGMVDSFLLASAQERKEFFEEASGVKPLQIKRSQSLNKLERTEENLETAQIQLNEISPRLNSLTRQVKKLERRTEVEKKLRKIEIKYYSALLSEINSNWKDKNDELKILSEKQEKIKTKTENLQNEIAKLTKDNVKSENFDKLQIEYKNLLDKKIGLGQKINDLKILQVQNSVKKSNEKDIPFGISKEITKELKELEKLNTKLLEETAPMQKIGVPTGNVGKKIKSILLEQKNILEKINQLLKPYQQENENNNEENNFEEKIKYLEKEIKEIDEKIINLQEEQKKQQENEKQERSKIWKIQESYQNEQSNLNKISNEVNGFRIELARLETRKDNLEQEARQEIKSLDEIDFNSDLKMDEEEKRENITEIGKLKHQLEIIGGIDPEVTNEFEETKERFDFLSDQTQDLKKSMDSLEKLILELDETIKKQFESNFKIINTEFEKYFKTLFAGGKAKLILIKNNENNLKEKDLEDTENNNTEENVEETEVKKIKDRLKSTIYTGVEIEATPPGKKLKSITMLSGGERAMTSIALICAIISANPSPFVVLDEVDAALDEANSIRYAEIIEYLADKSQFIIITHNRATMEKANILYGITMGDDGVSELLSLKLESAEKYTNR